MHLLRSLLLLLILVPLTLLVSVLTICDLTVGRRSPSKAQVFPRMWGKVICMVTGVKVAVEGLEHLDPNRTYIFVANHVSQFDIFSFQGYFPHDFRWIAKKELFRIPFFGRAMRLIGFVSIDRSGGKNAMKSLIEAAEKISAGTSVLIFPEGTRSPDGTLQPFKAGAILLAIKAGVPVVPIGFNGTYGVLPKKRLLASKGNVIIRIGVPIETKGYKPKDKQELAAELHDKVAALLS